MTTSEILWRLSPHPSSRAELPWNRSQLVYTCRQLEWRTGPDAPIGMAECLFMYRNDWWHGQGKVSRWRPSLPCLTTGIPQSHMNPCKEIKPVNPKGNQPWYSLEGLMLKLKLHCFGRTSCQTVKSQLTGKDPDAGKDWKQEEKGTTEGEMVGWHHLLNGHELEQILGGGEGQGILACCSPWGGKESDVTEQWTTATTRSRPRYFFPQIQLRSNLINDTCSSNKWLKYTVLSPKVPCD